MPLFSYLRLCDEVANCPAPTVGLIAQLEEHYTADQGDGFESLSCLHFFQAIVCVHNRDEVCYRKPLITVAFEILIAYVSVGAGQCTIKVQEHSSSIFEDQKGVFNDHSPFFLVCMTFASISISNTVISNFQKIYYQNEF